MEWLLFTIQKTMQGPLRMRLYRCMYVRSNSSDIFMLLTPEHLYKYYWIVFNKIFRGYPLYLPLLKIV